MNNQGVLDKSRLTQMEKDAIKEARLPLYNSLVAAGVAESFNNLSAEQIDVIIRACWDGCRASMHRQSALGELPV